MIILVSSLNSLSAYVVQLMYDKGRAKNDLFFFYTTNT